MTRGRPVSFDKNEALEKAMHVFWQSGYAGASYSDLCAATGLTKPSLYGAYGNKEETFIAALEVYVERYIHPGAEMLAEAPILYDGLHQLLMKVVGGLTASSTPPGCMLAANMPCITAASVSDPVAKALKKAIKITPDAIRQKLEDASKQELPAGTSPLSLALFYEAVIAGLSAMALQGASQEELMAVVESAMRIWPRDPGED